MKTPAAADLQRWSEDVARDASSLAFLPLARAYRRQGRRDAALRLCLKGLEAHPNHVEAHSLLALLYVETGERELAADEWSMVLRIDASNFDALRGLGFCYLESNELSRARYHLERASLIRPGDAAVQEALRLLRERIDEATDGDAMRGTRRRQAASPGVGSEQRSAPQAGDDRGNAAAAPGESTSGQPASAALAGDDGAAAAENAETVHASAADARAAVDAAEADRHASSRTNGAGMLPGDPAELFDSFLAAGPLLGALLLDGRGLVLAGRLGEEGAGEALGAVLGDAIGEASRSVGYLELGSWKGMLVETEAATVHVAPVNRDTVVLIAAKRSAPMGWVLRTALQVGGHARRFLGGA